jgi:hypothetical protein
MTITIILTAAVTALYFNILNTYVYLCEYFKKIINMRCRRQYEINALKSLLITRKTPFVNYSVTIFWTSKNYNDYMSYLNKLYIISRAFDYFTNDFIQLVGIMITDSDDADKNVIESLSRIQMILRDKKATIITAMQSYFADRTDPAAAITETIVYGLRVYSGDFGDLHGDDREYAEHLRVFLRYAARHAL